MEFVSQSCNWGQELFLFVLQFQISEKILYTEMLDVLKSHCDFIHLFPLKKRSHKGLHQEKNTYHKVNNITILYKAQKLKLFKQHNTGIFITK